MKHHFLNPFHTDITASNFDFADLLFDAYPVPDASPASSRGNTRRDETFELYSYHADGEDRTVWRITGYWETDGFQSTRVEMVRQRRANKAIPGSTSRMWVDV